MLDHLIGISKESVRMLPTLQKKSDQSPQDSDQGLPKYNKCNVCGMGVGPDFDDYTFHEDRYGHWPDTSMPQDNDYYNSTGSDRRRASYQDAQDPAYKGGYECGQMDKAQGGVPAPSAHKDKFEAGYNDGFGFHDSHRRRVARRNYNDIEKQGLIEEDGSATNLHKLDLSGTHYEQYDPFEIELMMGLPF